MEKKSRFQQIEFTNIGKGTITINKKTIKPGQRFVPITLSLKEIYKLYQSGEIMPTAQAEKIAAAKAESENVKRQLEADLKAEMKRIDDEIKAQMAEADVNN